MGRFYGSKLHLLTNFTGEIVDTRLTTANVHDTKQGLELSKKLTAKLYADKSYISKKLSESLKARGMYLVTTVRRNMKTKAM